MARTALKGKEPIRLREKSLSNGNKSLYLDIYQDGVRSYEFLKLYLIPETTKEAKQINSETLKVANHIKAQRLIDMNNGKAGIETTTKDKMLLTDFIDAYKREQSGKSYRWQGFTTSGTKAMLAYFKPTTRLKDITPARCKQYIEYLRTDYKTKNGKNIKQGTIKGYTDVLAGVLNLAVRRGYIAKSPLSMLDKADKPEPAKPSRTYLTADEVRMLIDTDCRNETIKRAFMFGCFCGLRWCDIKRLRWCDIATDNGKCRAEIVQQKTSEPLYLPLSNEALRWMPSRDQAQPTDLIFKLGYIAEAEKVLAQWAESAGVAKHVTFHVSRHTFATMALTLGADIYTASKLLGHTNIKTTQIYAEVVDEKKRQAVDLFDGIFSK